jgi:hypothetical protein
MDAVREAVRADSVKAVLVPALAEIAYVRHAAQWCRINGVSRAA